MQISTKSWHYRVIASDRDTRDIPTNLCPYMRALLFTLLKAVSSYTILGGFLAMMIGVWLAITIMPIFYLIDVFVWDMAWFTGRWGDQGYQAAAAFGGFLFYAVAGIAWGWKWVRDEMTRRAYMKAHRERMPEPEPGLVGSYIKSIHDKTCPLIEFVDKPAASQ